MSVNVIRRQLALIQALAQEPRLYRTLLDEKVVARGGIEPPTRGFSVASWIAWDFLFQRVTGVLFARFAARCIASSRKSNAFHPLFITVKVTRMHVKQLPYVNARLPTAADSYHPRYPISRSTSGIDLNRTVHSPAEFSPKLSKKFISSLLENRPDLTAGGLK